MCDAVGVSGCRTGFFMDASTPLSLSRKSPAELYDRALRHSAAVRRLKVLENEIAQMEGDCVLLETVALDRAQEDKVIARFKADRDDQYRELLGRCKDFEAEIAKEISIAKFTYAELDEEETDLKKLDAWFEKIRRLDFYDAPLAATAAERLRDCKALLDRYAQMVYDAHDENR